MYNNLAIKFKLVTSGKLMTFSKYLEFTGSSMLLDLHIEGSGPVTLLVRDESRSTRSTSACQEDDQCNSDENIAQIEEKCVRRVNDIQQVLGSTIGDESFDTLMDAGKCFTIPHRSFMTQFVDSNGRHEYSLDIKNLKEEVKDDNYESGISDTDEDSKDK